MNKIEKVHCCSLTVYFKMCIIKATKSSNRRALG
nr:MAG TPA: hypothetical protein [Bacteriophage sp.]DAG35471.1 MAG TPA: hypothetical protein [Bacteriophage sp.]